MALWEKGGISSHFNASVFSGRQSRARKDGWGFKRGSPSTTREDESTPAQMQAIAVEHHFLHSRYVMQGHRVETEEGPESVNASK